MAGNSRKRSERGNSQQMMGGLIDSAKQRPIAAAAAVGGAVAAGAFLWSRRDQIGEQISQAGDQVSEWSGKFRSGKSGDGSSMQSAGRRSTSMGVETGQLEMAGAGTSAARKSTRATGGRSGKAQTGQTLSPSRDASPTPSL